VVARKEYAQIFDAGGLWDEATNIFGSVGGVSMRGDKPMFKFPSGAKVYFKHSQHEQNVEKYWQGVQAANISLDEVTQFSKKEFLYIMSRNRSMTGIDSYIRATCNPDPRSWVKDFISWWIGDDGFIIPERSGVIRYFVHRKDKFIWGDTKDELIAKFGEDCNPKSFTFIRGYIKDNKKLLEKDPNYIASLKNLTESQRRALEEGNWNEVDNPLALFNHKNINANRVESVNLGELVKVSVGVDPAGSTNKNSDLTGIVTAGRKSDGHVYILKDTSGKYKPHEWAEKTCDSYDTFEADKIVAEKNYGGDMVESTIKTHRKNAPVKLVNASRGKQVRAQPVALLAEKGMLHFVGYEMKELEDECCDYVPGESDSPNRMDAMVWSVTDIALTQPKRQLRIG
jgi:phage terminase large subunit-like protein